MHYAPRLVLSCDNVVNFQVVYADGRIMNANKTAFPNLLTALESEKINLDIVTLYSMNAFEDEDLWGDIVTRPVSAVDQHFIALRTFSMNPNRDSPAVQIIARGYSFASTINKVRTSFNYMESAVHPDAYIESIAVIPSLRDTTMIQPMGEVDKTFGSYMKNK